MEQYQGKYKVVNYDWNQSLPEFFDNFEDALKARDAWDDKASIEQIGKEDAEIVYDRFDDDYITDSLYF